MVSLSRISISFNYTGIKKGFLICLFYSLAVYSCSSGKNKDKDSFIKNYKEIKKPEVPSFIIEKNATWNYKYNPLFWANIQGICFYEYYPDSGQYIRHWDDILSGTLVPHWQESLIIALTNGYHRDNLTFGSSDFSGIPESLNSIKRFNNGKCDPAGQLWVALWREDSVNRFDPESGKLMKIIIVPTPNVCSCTFRYKNLDMLYIATTRQGFKDRMKKIFPLSGNIFVYKPDSKGINANHFKRELSLIPLTNKIKPSFLNRNTLHNHA